MSERYERVGYSPAEDVWRAIGLVATTAHDCLQGYEIGSSITFIDQNDAVPRGRTLTSVPIEQDGERLLWPAYVMNDGDQGEGYAMISDREVVHWRGGQREIGGDILMRRLMAELIWFNGELADRTGKFQAVENHSQL